MNQPEANRKAEANLRRLICIRMFFHARFYYPIFALFFFGTWIKLGTVWYSQRNLGCDHHSS